MTKGYLTRLTFGEQRISSGSFSEQRRFTGHEYDAGPGLNYMMARYQDPKRGTFLSQDSVFINMGVDKHTKEALIDPQLQNSYSYARNNPIVFVAKASSFSPPQYILTNPTPTKSKAKRKKKD